MSNSFKAFAFDDDVLQTGRIAWAHLKEIRDYYARLDRLEAEAKKQT